MFFKNVIYLEIDKYIVDYILGEKRKRKKKKRERERGGEIEREIYSVVLGNVMLLKDEDRYFVYIFMVVFFM